MANVYMADARKLEDCVKRLFQGAGVKEEDASIIANCLAEADMTGVESHGITRIGVYMDHLEKGGFAKDAPLTVVNQMPATVAFDGNGGLGMPAAYRAMSAAIDKARAMGVGVATVRNVNHYGAAGYYTKMAARVGMIGVSLTNGQPAIAPWGGTKPYHGTNPFSIAFPTRSDPIVLDMASSVVARGKVILAERKGVPIPEGWALDAQGRPTTDPTLAIAGSMFPVGGVKGYGIALAVDLLGGILTGSNVGPHIPSFNDGTKNQGIGAYFMALNAAAFVGEERFLDDAEKLKAELKATPRIEGVEKICMPGEPEFDKRRARAEGGVPVSEVVYLDLQKMCEKYGVEFDILKDEGGRGA